MYPNFNFWEPIRTPDGRVFQVQEARALDLRTTPELFLVCMHVMNVETQDGRDFEVYLHWTELGGQAVPTGADLFRLARRAVGEWLYGHRSNMDSSVFPYAVKLEVPPRPEVIPI